MNRRLVRILLCLFFVSALCILTSFAQAPIDTSLPEAPLPHKRVLLLFPGYETVQDPNIPVSPLRTRQKFEMESSPKSSVESHSSG
jgi:hypothetical protein